MFNNMSASVGVDVRLITMLTSRQLTRHRNSRGRLAPVISSSIPLAELSISRRNGKRLNLSSPYTWMRLGILVRAATVYGGAGRFSLRNCIPRFPSRHVPSDRICEVKVGLPRDTRLVLVLT